MLYYNFKDKLDKSMLDNKLDKLHTLLPYDSVTQCPIELDKQGGDYSLTISGSIYYVDIKKREKGCSKYWSEGPEVALEIWSVVGKKVGWTLDTTKITDYVYFIFDDYDTEDCFLFQFKYLFNLFWDKHQDWQSRFKSAIQSSGTWKSECVFVPIKYLI